MCNCTNAFNAGRPRQQPAAAMPAVPLSSPANRGIIRTTASRQPQGVRVNVPFMGRPRVFNNSPILR